jgi:hypothetical protein
VKLIRQHKQLRRKHICGNMLKYSYPFLSIKLHTSQFIVNVTGMYTRDVRNNFIFTGIILRYTGTTLHASQSLLRSSGIMPGTSGAFLRNVVSGFQVFRKQYQNVPGRISIKPALIYGKPVPVSGSPELISGIPGSLSRLPEPVSGMPGWMLRRSSGLRAQCSVASLR